ncbi:alpha-taxilin-like, partial [Elysia marginata]
MAWSGIELATSRSRVRRANHSVKLPQLRLLLFEGEKEAETPSSRAEPNTRMSEPDVSAVGKNRGSCSGIKQCCGEQAVKQQPQAATGTEGVTDKQPVVLDPSLSAALGDVPSVPLTEGQDTADEEEEEGSGDGVSLASPSATVVPSNTPVTADSGQGSPAMQSSSESLSDDLAGQEVNSTEGSNITDTAAPAAGGFSTCNGDSVETKAAPPTAPVTKQTEAPAAPVTKPTEAPAAPVIQPRVEQSAKEAKRQERKEEKKKQKKKEDKGIEYILRALNSLQTPEEKLAALCKKYADLNEEHRVLQTSFKTQQRTMTVVMREKDQLQADHTRAMMAKSKLESLCRELQKHNKIIKEESIKRAKEDDEKRKEISAQFNNTIGEIQTQMNENTERNSKLRQENENLAAQLKAFINSIELRDQQVEKIQKHHELEKKLFEAKLKQAEAVLAENSEKNNKERELVMLKLAEVNKKNAVVEAQLNMYKERYAAFEALTDNIGKYKSEMDKMTKRIKKLEKDGLQWKTKWENSNKALIEQMDARSKSEKETLTYAQKVRKLESLCRALQAELHKKGPAQTEDTG